jgi:hypothetical protein
MASGQAGDALSVNVVALQEEIMEQKLLIEEKTQELEERNLLLVKARNAIESLQVGLGPCGPG